MKVRPEIAASLKKLQADMALKNAGARLAEKLDLPFFGYPGEWARFLGQSLSFVVTAPKVDRCVHCGRGRGIFPGAHAPRHSSADPTVVVDCIGRPCVKDGDGYYQVAA